MKFKVLVEKVEEASPKKWPPYPGCCPPSILCTPGVWGPTIGAM